MTYCIYILFSDQANKYYVGYSKDPWKRFEQHLTNEGNTFTGKFKNWRMMAVFEVGNDESEAMRIERFIKKQKTRRFIELLISPDFVPKDKLALFVRVPLLRD